MPILVMALLALAVFVIMGLMLFYAAYSEAREPKRAEKKLEQTAASEREHAAHA